MCTHIKKKSKNENVFYLELLLQTTSYSQNVFVFFQIEKLKHSLMNAESDSKIQRKRTITLKNAIELRPSPDTIWKLQTQNDLLTARIQELEDSRQVEHVFDCLHITWESF